MVFFQKGSPGGGRFAAVLNKVLNYVGRNGVLAISAAGNDRINWDHSWDYVNVPAESGNGVAVSATAPTGFSYGGTDFDTPSSYTGHGGLISTFEKG